MNYSGQIEFTPSADDAQDPDLIYYSGIIINDALPSTSGIDPPIRFIETRVQPLVKDASKYHFSIIRFQMNGAGKDLPIWCPVIETGANNPTQDVNLTIYKITLRCTFKYTVPATGVSHTITLTSTKPIIYTTETLNTALAPIPPPSSTQTGQIIAPSRYYWVYTYSTACNLVNTTFESCIADLQTQFNAWYLALPGAIAPAPTIATKAPKLTYNPDNNLFSLYCDTYGFGGTARTGLSTADEDFKIFFNAPLFGLFANFENKYLGDVVLTNEIIVKNIGGLYQNVVSVGAPLSKSFWVMVQDYESTSTLWSPVDSIVFISGLLPLVTENSSDPIRFGQSNLGNTPTSQGFEPVVTDVALEQTNAHSYREYFQYVPTGEYRLTSTLRSKNPISSFDISCFWRCRLDGKLYPLQLFCGSSASIKIMLRRRGINDYPHPRKEFGIDV